MKRVKISPPRPEEIYKHREDSHKANTSRQKYHGHPARRTASGGLARLAPRMRGRMPGKLVDFYGGICFLLISFFFLAVIHTASAGVMQDAEKALFVNFMVDFATPEGAGFWKGWNYSNDKVRHNPETKDAAGRRDIASCYYPVIGIYDMTDPDLAAYHCQLMKMSGIDGAVFTLGFYKDPNHGNNKRGNYHQKVMTNYLTQMEQYGLKGALLFEDKANWLWNSKLKNRTETVWAAFHDLEQWIESFEPVQYRIAGRPLVFLFSYGTKIPGRGESRFSPTELNQWKQGLEAEAQPVFVAQWFSTSYVGALDGYFEWPFISGKPPEGVVCRRYNDYAKEVSIWEARHEEMYVNLSNGNYQFVAGGVWPGFEDSGCCGWGKGNRIIPRFDGKIYTYHWKRMIQSDYPVVQVATWNDWYEGTVIEPTHEFGYQYLEMTRAYAAQWRREEIPEGNLKVPEWIYKIRKQSRNKRILRKAAKAGTAIAEGDYKKAEALIKPYVEKLSLDKTVF
ncbi:glycoside hydrolase family 99-like domain-containing protein [bacterium]|nr:glycoside hydrolase family 99-like domain-containing protein [bacterium]